MKKSLVGLVLTSVLAGLSVYADDAFTPGMAPFRVATRSDHHFQLALFPPLQLVPASEEVSGLRLNLLVGSNRAVDGLDIGLINHTREMKSGIGLGLLNICGGEGGGLYLGLANFSGGGDRVGAFGMDGLQVGLLNKARGFTGLQLGALNIVSRSGFTASRSSIQLGLVNISGDLEKGGVQFGLINIAGRGGVLPVMPLVNGRF